LKDQTGNRRNKLLYAIGSIGDTGSYVLVSTYLQFFLIDVAFLNAWLAGIIYMIAYGIWNAINDPIIGFVSDRTRTRWGRRKPFIFIGASFSLIFYILIWGPPLGLSTISIFFYLLFIIIAYEFFYSMAAVTWFAVYPELWESVKERSEVVIYRQVFAIVGGIFASGIFPILQANFAVTFGEIPSWMISSAIVGALFTITFLVSLFGIKERKEFSMEEKFSLGGLLKKNLRSKPLLTYMGIHTMTFAMAGWQSAIAPFFIVHSLGLGIDIMALLMLPSMITTIAFFPLWRKIYMKLGPKKSVGAAATVNIFCYIPVLFITGILGVLLWGFFIGVGTSGILVTREVMVADVCDADECKMGVRNEGSIFGFTKLSSRASLMLVGLFTSLLLDAIIGYDPLLPDPPLMDILLRLGFFLVTLLFTLILYLSLALYPLNTLKVEAMHQELEEKRRKKKEKLE